MIWQRYDKGTPRAGPAKTYFIVESDYEQLEFVQRTYNDKVRGMQQLDTSWIDTANGTCTRLNDKLKYVWKIIDELTRNPCTDYVISVTVSGWRGRVYGILPSNSRTKQGSKRSGFTVQGIVTSCLNSSEKQMAR